MEPRTIAEAAHLTRNQMLPLFAEESARVKAS